MKINKFEELEIWKISIDLAIKVYSLTNNKHFTKDFGFKDQIRRASTSISSNIAEGFEMSNNNDLVKFLRIAKGSAGEVRSQIELAFGLKYINQLEYKELITNCEEISAKIGKFIVYLVNKRKDKEFLTR